MSVSTRARSEVKSTLEDVEIALAFCYIFEIAMGGVWYSILDRMLNYACAVKDVQCCCVVLLMYPPAIHTVYIVHGTLSHHWCIYHSYIIYI